MNGQYATVRPRRNFPSFVMAPLLSYLAKLSPGRSILWCYLIWYLRDD